MDKPLAYSTILETNLPVTMRDGTTLRADVYRPNAPGKFPVLLHRTPYDKALEKYSIMARKMAERGYLVVSQDVRGRFASDGEFKPGFYSSDTYDARDGYDSVEWAAALPQSNGAVGTIGGSYAGWTQWELAHTRPPHLKAMLPQAICASLLDREMSGVLRLGRVLWWTVNTLAPDERRRLNTPSGPHTVVDAERLWADLDRSKWLWYLPLMDIPEDAMTGMGKHWRRWLKDHATDHFGFERIHCDVNVPALHTTGWYDQQVGATKNFTGMVKNGMTEHARQNQHVIIGPWSHVSYELPSKTGDVDFGPAATQDFHEIADQWFGKWLKGEKTEADRWPAVRYFVMGSNVWKTADAWPLPGTKYTPYYFHSGGRANTPFGDGALSRLPPREWRPEHNTPDGFTYDPRDPVMTHYSVATQQEPHDQRVLDDRRDVLVYATPPLEKAVEVAGPMAVKLFAATSARDTDFTVKLVDVWPNGFAQDLCYGIVRARYRESYTNPTLLEPDKVYEYNIQVNPTANLFKAGHRIRVDISSSDFPNFDRNHNTGGNDYAEAKLVVAHQTVFHDAARPSHIVLPMRPGE